MQKLDVNLNSGIGITKIDEVDKKVTDTHGIEHTYDLLIMATGSRAFVPSDVKMDAPGRFTMRERGDADKLKQ